MDKLTLRRLDAFGEQILKMQIAEKILQADRDWVKHLGEDNLSVQLTAVLWAKKAGYQANPKDIKKIIRAYTSHLNDEIVKTQLRIKGLTKAKAAAAEQVRKYNADQAKDAKFREEISRTRKLFEAAKNSLSKEHLTRNAGGFAARMLTEIQAREVGKKR